MNDEIKLPVRFNSGGFEMVQVHREGDLAIFEQRKFGRVISFEAVKIKHAPARKMPSGAVHQASEQYPSPSEWGRTAWTCDSLSRAHKRLVLLTERKNL